MKKHLTTYSFHILIIVTILFTSCSNGKITYEETSETGRRAILTNKSKSKRIEFTVKSYTTRVVSKRNSYVDEFKHYETNEYEDDELIKLNPGESKTLESWSTKTIKVNGDLWEDKYKFKVVGELEIK